MLSRNWFTASTNSARTDIPGIASFEGKVVHTTAWDHSYGYEGRRIGVIGTGASAVQVIPELAKEAAELTVYQHRRLCHVPVVLFQPQRRSNAVAADVDTKCGARSLEFPAQRLLVRLRARARRS